MKTMRLTKKQETELLKLERSMYLSDRLVAEMVKRTALQLNLK